MLQILKPFYSPSFKVLKDKGISLTETSAWSLLNCTSSIFSSRLREAAPLGYVELGKVSVLQGWARDVSKSMVDLDCVLKTTISGLSSVFV